MGWKHRPSCSRHSFTCRSLTAAVWGIVIAVREGNDQATLSSNQLTVLQRMQQNAVTQADNDQRAMAKQNGILSNLQDATKATADAMKNLRQSSESTKSSTSAMAKSLQDELSLYFNA